MPLAPDTLRHLKRGAITFGAYLLSGIASLSLANTTESVSLLYIAAGFGLAFVLVWGPWMALAVGLGSAAISLIAENTHPDALRLYAAKGYAEVARRPVVKGDWQVDAQDWILMIKPLA